ncbi:uncharacterized protein FOMMEDRAFT_74821, partial [Fomitiporia mediterranea MF3/22]|uniref:uncharacterized protein n=1 Tax=Fomitiporia mediterranea (strain MF3/22) TaxID=694068 RepID=UPI00044088C7
YDKAIDKLEGEVMAQLFELAKMNQAGTRYKQRHYISKGIKAQSKTVMAAVKSYNDAATQLGLPSLKVSTVLKYIFIGQFDVLCLGCLQVDQKPWIQEAEHNAALKFFKLKQSYEELWQLNIEI